MKRCHRRENKGGHQPLHLPTRCRAGSYSCVSVEAFKLTEARFATNIFTEDSNVRPVFTTVTLGGDKVSGSPTQLIATIVAPAVGSGSSGPTEVYGHSIAPFYGSYGTLPESEAMAEASFIGAAHWPGGENGDGYYLVHRDVTPGGDGLYRFDAAVWRQLQDSGLGFT